MPTTPLGLQSFDRDFESLSVERLINCFVEQATQSATSPIPILGTPGHVTAMTIGTGPIREAVIWQRHRYIISGAELYKVNAAGAATLLGAVPGTGHCTMGVMNAGVLIVCGGKYFHTDGVTLTAQALPAFTGFNPTPDSVTVINNTGIIGFAGSDFYTWTAPNEPDNINAIDVARGERKSDETLRVYSDNNELLLFGRKSIEILYDTAIATGRWQSAGAGVVERGCIAFGSITTIDNTTVWLGDDLSLYRLNGRTPQRISTHWFEYQVQRFIKVSDAVAFAHTWNGHKLYTISFPAEGRTFCIDLNTGLPHERRTWNQSYYRGCVAIPSDENESLIGSAFDGQIFRQDEQIFQESGDYLERVIRTPYTYTESGEPLENSQLGLILDTGRAPANLDTSEAEVMMRYTNDGRNWSGERQHSLGEVGRYGVKVRWHQMGQSQTGRRAYEFRSTAALPWRVVRAFIGAEQGLS